ncbi:hypothetical protein KKG45_14465 [bacterium]|nr:hypothetical protein [bacterium]MBU1676224.1 hypothetical protein [bacterium]
MSGNCKCIRNLTVTFEEIASLLEGVRKLYPLPDEAIWEMARALDRIHEDACRRSRTSEFPNEAIDDSDHPAILFLHTQILGRGADDPDYPGWW